MRNFHRTVAAVAAAVISTASNLNAAQPEHRAAVGDLMTAFIQPRHIKLGLAGNERNWTYAGYELDQLRETFADVAEIMPKYRNLSISDLITVTVENPLAALDQAIKAKDPARFGVAYRRLTAACNACHRSYDRAMIVIQAPKAGPYPDQNFQPGK